MPNNEIKAADSGIKVWGFGESPNPGEPPGVDVLR
jgi:hypothetical protein